MTTALTTLAGVGVGSNLCPGLRQGFGEGVRGGLEARGGVCEDHRVPAKAQSGGKTERRVGLVTKGVAQDGLGVA